MFQAPLIFHPSFFHPAGLFSKIVFGSSTAQKYFFSARPGWIWVFSAEIDKMMFICVISVLLAHISPSQTPLFRNSIPPYFGHFQGFSRFFWGKKKLAIYCVKKDTLILVVCSETIKKIKKKAKKYFLKQKNAHF